MEVAVLAEETRVLIVFYSLYGNTAKLARAVAAGVDDVAGCKALLRRAEETMPKETVELLSTRENYRAAQESMKDIPFAKTDELTQDDGVIFGSPSQFGNMAAQLKQFIDATVPLWVKGALAGKTAAAFCTSGSLHGGNEGTLISMLLPMLHHGMIIVGRTYEDYSLAASGAPYGATAVSGAIHDKEPSEADEKVARLLGRRVAEVTKRLTGR
jgi:NAD(P)H dehydrogenase (quinone)